MSKKHALKSHIALVQAREHALRLKYKSAVPSLTQQCRQLRADHDAQDARIAELERALAAAEARERKSYLLLARWLDKDPIGGVMLKPQTRSHLDAILDAIRALAKERT